jgi:hypothetical protein
MKEIITQWVIPILVGIDGILLAAVITQWIGKELKITVVVGILFLLVCIVLTKIIYNPLVEIPSVLYKSQDEAELTVKQNNLDLSIIQEWHNQVPKYRVISQDPQAGIFVKKGSKISISVSKGPKPDELPPISNGDPADIKWVKTSWNVERKGNIIVLYDRDKKLKCGEIEHLPI